MKDEFKWYAEHSTKCNYFIVYINKEGNHDYNSINIYESDELRKWLNLKEVICIADSSEIMYLESIINLAFKMYMLEKKVEKLSDLIQI